MKISYNWLKDYIPKLPKPEKLAELLTLHSIEVLNLDEVKIKNAEGKKDWIFNLDVSPNRAHDCLSHSGVAREVAAITKLKVKSTPRTETKFLVRGQKLKVPVQNRKLKIKDFLRVEIKDKELCQRYTARVMTGVKISPSPEWMIERLNAIGQKSINNVVDCTNYVMFEVGQPLHAFDLDKLCDTNTPYQSKHGTGRARIHANVANKKLVIVRRAKKGEKIVSLDGEERELNDPALVIADSKRPIAIAGIIGGANTEVDDNTKNLILESANFNQTNVRRSSRRLGVRTESSLRFEEGIDPNLAGEAVDRLALLIQKTAGGKIAGGMVDIYPKKVFPKKIKLDIRKIKSLLGLEISEKKIRGILKRTGLIIYDSKPQILIVEVPTYRQDIMAEEDLIEEVARIYGYENIPEIHSFAESRVRTPENHIVFSRLSRNLMRGIGYSETYNVSFLGEHLIKKVGFGTTDHIAIKNPVSEDFAFLRISLVPLVLENISSNVLYFRSVRLFELGKVYFKKEGNLCEKNMICFANIRKSDVSESGKKFYEIKGEVEDLLSGLGILDVSFFGTDAGVSKNGIWHPKNSASIKIGDETFGHFGQINPLVTEKLNIREYVFAAELDFDKLVKLATIDDFRYTPPSRYQATFRDVALLVNPGIKVEDILNVINRVGGVLVKDVDLFDMYEGEELPEGKKNLAFHIIYQSDDRTLNSQEVDELHRKIEKALEEEMGAETRG